MSVERTEYESLWKRVTELEMFVASARRHNCNECVEMHENIKRKQNVQVQILAHEVGGTKIVGILNLIVTLMLAILLVLARLN